MSKLKKARMHSKAEDGSVVDDLDIYTSSDAVIMDDGRSLEDIYKNDIGESSGLNTENKKLVDAVNEVALAITTLNLQIADLKAVQDNLISISSNLSDFMDYVLTNMSS